MAARMRQVVRVPPHALFFQKQVLIESSGSDHRITASGCCFMFTVFAARVRALAGSLLVAFESRFSTGFGHVLVHHFSARRRQ